MVIESKELLNYVWSLYQLKNPHLYNKKSIDGYKTALGDIELYIKSKEDEVNGKLIQKQNNGKIPK